VPGSAYSTKLPSSEVRVAKRPAPSGGGEPADGTASTGTSPAASAPLGGTMRPVRRGRSPNTGVAPHVAAHAFSPAGPANAASLAIPLQAAEYEPSGGTTRTRYTREPSTSSGAPGKRRSP
jgi:hypothetical protein